MLLCITRGRRVITPRDVNLVVVTATLAHTLEHLQYISAV